MGDVGSSSAELWIPRLPDFGAIVASPVALGGVLWTGDLSTAQTGVVTTAIALWIESIAFARVSATDASIILTTEPLFAAAFSAVSLGETFDSRRRTTTSVRRSSLAPLSLPSFLITRETRNVSLRRIHPVYLKGSGRFGTFRIVLLYGVMHHDSPSLGVI